MAVFGDAWEVRGVRFMAGSVYGDGATNAGHDRLGRSRSRAARRHETGRQP